MLPSIALIATFTFLNRLVILLVSLEQAVDKDGSHFEGWCGEDGGGRRGQVGQCLSDKSDLFFLSDSVGEYLSYCGPVQFFNFLFHVSFRLEADKESFRSQLDAAARKRKVEMEDELNVKKKKILEDELNAKKKKIIEEEVDAKKSRASKVHTSQYFSFLQISIEITRCSKMPASSLTMSQMPPLRNQQPLMMSFLRDLSRKVPTLLPSQGKL